MGVLTIIEAAPKTALLAKCKITSNTFIAANVTSNADVIRCNNRSTL